MLTTDDLARLNAFVAAMTDARGEDVAFAFRTPAGDKYHVKVGELVELCRVYAAVLGAPEVWARPWIWEEVPEELEGQLIRLVPLVDTSQSNRAKSGDTTGQTDTNVSTGAPLGAGKGGVMIDRESCEGCKFFRGPPSKWDSTGLCRRWPPSLAGSGDSRQRAHPKVHAYDWCGEFRPVAVTARGGEWNDNG